MLNAKNGVVELPDGRMDYVRFGSGKKTMLLIPGLSESLQSVRGTALPMALSCRQLAGRFTVYMPGRRRDLPAHFSIREMASDTAAAMEALGIGSACVLGVSQGGMIAQYLALDHPEKVERLVLAVTMGRQNPTVDAAVRGWMAMAGKGDYRSLMVDTAERSYSPRRKKAMRAASALLAAVRKPKDFSRFLTQAEACLGHDAYDRLGEIRCPVLVIGGTEDQVVSGEASRELAAAIPGAELYMYEGLSHAVFDEAGDFFERAAAFFTAG